MSRFLVTGGAGFIGSHITEALIKKGHFVRVLDNFSSGKEGNLSRVMQDIELMRADIRSQGSCLQATRGIDFVLHQAALRSVPKSMIHPAEYNEVNIAGILNMLDASRQNQVKRFIFASSSSVYGEADTFPEKESFLPRPISPYALTKLAGEYYCKIFSRHYGLDTVSLRYFNVFGPRQSLDDEYAVVIPKFINCMLKNEAVPVYGNGKQSRDFTYIDNVVEANILAAEKCGLKEGVFNVASGKDYSILELLKQLNKIMRKDIQPSFLPARPGDVFKTLADISNSNNLLGFVPKTDFIAGLHLAVKYFKEQ